MRGSWSDGLTIAVLLDDGQRGPPEAPGRFWRRPVSPGETVGGERTSPGRSVAQAARKVPAMPAPGPLALGRGVVVLAGDPVPDAWDGAPVVRVDAGTLDDPAAAVAALHDAWLDRTPVVVELAIDPAHVPGAERPGTTSRGGSGPWFEPWLDRLHFLVWANTYDARDGHAGVVVGAARRSGSAPRADAGAAAGRRRAARRRPAWVDGGPRDLLAPTHRRRGRRARRLGRARPAHRRCPPPAPPTADLAPDQLAAVAHGAGPARIDRARRARARPGC